MHPVFLARGPAFRQNYVKHSMRSVDLYPLMCHILALRPLPNNGSLANVQILVPVDGGVSSMQALPNGIW